MTESMRNEGGHRAVRNPTVAPAAEPYGPARSQILNDAGFSAAQHEIMQWPGYAPTPLRTLPSLDGDSRVLLLGSEGDTDPEIYRHITGRTADEVRA